MTPQQVENDVDYNDYEYDVELHGEGNNTEKMADFTFELIFERINVAAKKCSSESKVKKRVIENDTGCKRSIYDISAINDDDSLSVIRTLLNENDASDTNSNATRKPNEPNNLLCDLSHSWSIGRPVYGIYDSFLELEYAVDHTLEQTKCRIMCHVCHHIKCAMFLFSRARRFEKLFDAFDSKSNIFLSKVDFLHSQKASKGDDNIAGLDTKCSHDVAWLNPLKTHFREIKVLDRLKFCEMNEVVEKKEVKLSCAHFALNNEQSQSYIKNEANAQGNQMLELTGDDHVAESRGVPDGIDGEGLPKHLIGSDYHIFAVVAETVKTPEASIENVCLLYPGEVFDDKRAIGPDFHEALTSTALIENSADVDLQQEVELINDDNNNDPQNGDSEEWEKYHDVDGGDLNSSSDARDICGDISNENHCSLDEILANSYREFEDYIFERLGTWSKDMTAPWELTSPNEESVSMWKNDDDDDDVEEAKWFGEVSDKWSAPYAGSIYSYSQVNVQGTQDMPEIYIFQEPDGYTELNVVEESKSKDGRFTSKFFLACLSLIAVKEKMKQEAPDRGIVGGCQNILAKKMSGKVKSRMMKVVLQRLILAWLLVAFVVNEVGSLGMRSTSLGKDTLDLTKSNCDDEGKKKELISLLLDIKASNLSMTPGFTLGKKEVPVNSKSKKGKDFLRDILNIPDFLQLPPQVIQAYPVFAESGYNSEFMRLASFSKCPEQNWYPAVPLSENGFYLIPVSTVICHFCKSTYPTWQKDWNPKQKHQPGCPILSGECANIPMKPSADNGKYQTAVQYAMTDLQLPQIHHKIVVLLRNSTRAVEAFKNPQLPEVQMGSLSIVNNAGQTEYDAMEEEPQSSTSNGASNTSQGPIDGASNTRGLRYFIHTYDEQGRPISTSQKVDFSNKDDKTNASMKREIDRLQTYTNWKKHNIIKPEELAKAGFYYADSGDRVRCAFCSGVLRNWASGDRATTEHKRHYPTCPFVLNLDVGNVSLVPDQSSLQSPTPATSNPIARNGTNTTTQKAPTAQRSTSNVPLLTAGYTPSPIAGTILIPKHTNFSTAEARMLTYESWPTTNVQRPTQLAEAGFFYTGSGDNVRCFHCDGGLRNWLDADLPWIEHAKWFPRCGYLQREKGPEFVLEETRKHSQQNFSGGMTQVRSTGASSTPGTGNSSAGVRRVEAREVRARFDTDQVKMILEMGYKEAVVKYVILQRLKHTGDDFGSIQEMLEAVLTEEPNLEEKGVSYYENILQQEFGRPMTIVYPQVPQLPGPGSNQENSTPTSATPMTQSTAASLEIPGDEKSLVEENRQLKEQTTCKICMDNEVSMVFVPCGHLVACADCAPNLRQCPICRRAITATIRTFLS